MLPLLTSLLLAVLYVAATLLVVDIARVTFRHYSRGNEHHLLPLPVHQAFVVAVVEVCWDRPRAFHHARMDAVRRAEERRADAIEDAMLRHPSNYQARRQCKANHPSATGHTAPTSPTHTPTHRPTDAAA